MKNVIILFLLFQVSNAFSQPLHIKGNVSEKMNYKYALLYNSSYTLLDSDSITNNTFELSHTYQPNIAPSYWPVCKLVFSANKTMDDESIRGLRMDLFYGDDLNISYADKFDFHLIGGSENRIQNKFIQLKLDYLRGVDSASKNIESQTSTIELKQEQKRQIRNTLNKLMQNRSLAIIKENSNAIASLFNLLPLLLFKTVSYQDASGIFDNVSVKLKKERYGLRVAELISKLKEPAKNDYPTAPKLAVGDMMYDFSLPDINDKNIKATEVYGTYTLIDFWATWCIPCREETPNLLSAYKRFADKGFKIITVSTDVALNKEKWKAAVQVDGMSVFTNLINPTGTPGIAKELNINAIPANYLIDKQGKVVAINLRGKDLENLLVKIYQN
jgi:peroxiredoxin